jgi:hypothetical protein
VGFSFPRAGRKILLGILLFFRPALAYGASDMPVREWNPALWGKERSE